MADIYIKMAEVMSKITAISKERKNIQQNFLYRGIEDVYNSVQPVLARAGIFMSPEVLSHHREERVNKSGTTLSFSRIVMRYTFYAPDGSSVSCSVMGEGMDTGDKSSNKAMAAAHKYALFQVFAIPTSDLDDPDAESHQLRGKKHPHVDIERIRDGFGECHNVADLTAVLQAVGISRDHPQAPDVSALYKARRSQIEAMGEAYARQDQTENEPATPAQIKSIQAHYGKLTREQRLAEAGRILGREIATFSALSRADASAIFDVINTQEAK